MANTNTQEVVKSELEVLIDKINATEKNTQKIRLALNYFKPLHEKNDTTYRSKVVKLLQKLNVKSKDGNDISYQYVRNIELQVVSSK